VFCRVTHVQAPEGRVHEGLKLWRDNVLPVMQARTGFRGALSLADLDSGRALSISFWEGEDAMREEAAYHERAIEHFGEFFANASEPENMQLHLFTGEIFNGTYAADDAGGDIAAPSAGR
jgi:hypothetical protein